MRRSAPWFFHVILPMSLLAAMVLLVGASPAPAAQTATAGAAQTSAASTAHSSAYAPRVRPKARPKSPYLAARHSESATAAYPVQLGVDALRVQQTASGALIRFTYKVVDVNKAKLVADKAENAYLVAPSRGVVLQVPVMEKVGPLRQTNEVVAGKDYWMVFSNKGNVVKPGDRVSVIVGKFRVDGLVVQP